MSRSAEDLGLVLAEPQPDEVRFILDAWTRSYRDSPWAGTVTNDRYAETQRWTITSLMARGAKILVAIPAIGPRRIAGFVCYESPGLMHYLYVKQAFRGLGVARMLSDVAKGLSGLDTPGRFTHRTRASQWLLEDGWRWDPTPARTKEHARDPKAEQDPGYAASPNRTEREAQTGRRPPHRPAQRDPA